MKKRILIIGIILVFLNISIASSLEINKPMNISELNSIWPMFHQNPQHTGLSIFNTKENPGHIKWTVNVWQEVTTSTAIASDGTLYIGTGSSAIDDGNFFAINNDGTKKWEFNIYGSPIRSSPALNRDESTIYFGSDDGILYALNTNYGWEKWKYETEKGISSSPVIDENNIIYFGSKDKNLYAIYPDGTLKWKFDVSDEIYSSPAIGYDGTVYVGSYGKNLTAINSDGTLKWKFQTQGRVSSSPAIGKDGTVYFGSDDCYLYALDAEGNEKWKYLTGDTIYSSPAIDQEGCIYFGSFDNYIYGLNPDGCLKWRYMTDGNVKSSPAISADGIVYIGSNDNNLYAIDINGNFQWKTKLNGIVSSPAIGNDGNIYVGSQGYFYAIGESDNPEAPIKPDKPYGGPYYGEVNENYCYDTKSVDPNNDGIRYYFDWGDGTGEWTEYKPSNVPVSAWHTWEQEGTFDIRVKAEDENGYQSKWSDPLSVYMPRNRVLKSEFMRYLEMDFSFLNKIIEIINLFVY